MKNLIKYIVYGLSSITYLDIFVNPNKGFTFLKMDRTLLSIIALTAFLSLLTLILAGVKNWAPARKATTVSFLVTALLIGNEVLFSYTFHQGLDFVIALLLLCPIPLLLHDMFPTWRNKTTNLVIIGSSIVLLLTLVYFVKIYVPYEAYVMDFPIVFVHHWIRNWLVSISILTLVCAVLQKVTADSGLKE